ncbi:MAG: transporter [Gammaproteobacteria bacterium]|nr:MAG: transporter [Gammaproteobacteria bacterium]
MNTVVLTHGWGYGDAVWAPLAARLEARGWTVRHAGLPGFDGRRALPPDGWHRALAANVPDGALWVAWSLGGRLALRAVAEGQAHPGALCLVGVGLRFVGPKGQGQPPEALAAFRAGLADPPRLLRRFAGLVAQGDPARGRLLRYLRGLPPAASAETLAQGLELLEAPLDLQGFPGALPVHLLQGTEDALVPDPAARALVAALPRARLHRLPTGHAPQLSDPETFASLLEALP